MIDVQRITKTYRRTKVLQDVSLKVERGEFLGIIGPNGSGKSTLLNLLSGVEEPDQGQIRLAGQLLSSFTRKSLSQRLAVLQQDGLPSISYPVKEIIEMGRFPFQDWRGREKDNNAESLIIEIMDRLELKEMAERPLSVLSGGQRQRVALGKVMAQQPEVVLLDEPTTYLDIRYQMQFMDLVASWKQEQGLTVISVMHDLNLASLYCDRLLILSQGKIVAEGTPDEILVPETVESVFDVKSHAVVHPDTGVPQLLLQKGG